jgi:hypothetical protein
VGPKGAQRRLQQSLQVPQREPSTPRPLQFDAPLGGSPQVPTVAPVAMSQVPVQHSSARVQMSPCCVQKEECRAHFPFVQRPEQQSSLFPQVLPAVLHPVFSATQEPLTQLLLQHCAAPVQVAPSETQALAEHAPFTQLTLQQSPGAAQDVPAGLHFPMLDVQVFVDGSQMLEQHAAPVVQGSP